MKKLITLVFIALLYCISINAQNQQDIILLNNGSVVKGEIISSVPNISVKIQTLDGKQYEYLMTEIRQITQGSVVTPIDPQNKKYIHFSEYEKGYWIAGEVSAGASIMHGKRNVGFTQLAMINGYRFCDYLRVGIGLGVRYYVENDNRRIKSSPWAFPVFLDLRGNFTSQKLDRVAPYWAFDTGATFTDGFFFSPTLGVKFGGNRSNFLLGLSYTGQNMRTYKISGDDAMKKSNELNHMLSLKLGYEF